MRTHGQREPRAVTVPGMKTMKKLATLPAAAMLLFGGLTACGGSDERLDDGRATQQETNQPELEATEEPEPEYDGKAYAKKVRKAVETNFGGARIPSRCKATELTWHCFFDAYESPSPGRINVRLSFPGDTAEAEARSFSGDARLHTFNLAGLEVTDLDTVVSYANGLDTGTTWRADVPLLN